MILRKIIAAVCAGSMLCGSSAALAAYDGEALPAAENEAVEEYAEAELDIAAETKVFEGGTGTEEDPFLVSTPEQLELMHDFSDCSFTLLNNIEITGKWDDLTFSGVFDGNNCKITCESFTKGFIKTNKGTIKNLAVTGKASGEDACLLVGYNYGTIENCYAEGEVSGSYDSAGFVYYNESSGVIKNCYARTNVSGSYSAGFVYDNNGNNGSISNCYWVGTASRGMTYSSYTMSNCYYDKQVSSKESTEGGTIPKNTLAMKMQATYQNWDFDTVWGIDSEINDGYPYLQSFEGASSSVTIGLNRSAAVMSVGGSLELTADVKGNDSGRTVSWSSSDTSVATVSAEGVVTAKSIGKAVITAAVGAAKAKCEIEVVDNAVAVTGLTLDNTELELVIGEKAAIKATVTPSNATNKTLTWQNLNPETVSFNSSTGEVTAVAEGTARIRAVTNDGGYTADCEIQVYNNSIKVTSVTLDRVETGIGIGEQVKLRATVLPENATNKSIRWSSLNQAVATVSNDGAVTGISEGTTQIYATSASDSACYAICRITVARQKIPVTGIEFSDNLFGTPFEVNIGKAMTFSPTIKPGNATNKDIRWTSSDEGIATVTNGKVKGVAEGTAMITATTVDGGYSASVTVKVTKPTVYVTGIALNTEQMTVDVKTSKKLVAAITPLDATDQTVSFKSNNNAIANVTAEGTVTGVSPGTTLIQAISDTSAGRYIAFCTVTVPKPVIEVTSIKLDKGSLEVVEGKTVPLKAVIKPANATYKNITWSESDSSIVTVDQNGAVTARGVGDAVVSATAANGVHVECAVKVLSSDTPAQLKVEDTTAKAGKQVPVTVSIASNPGISTFNFDLTYDNTKMYPVSYTKGAALDNVNVVTPLGSLTFEDKSSVRFLCSTADSRNMDTDGDLITVMFQTRSGVEYGDYTIGITPIAFTDQNYEAINLREDNCTLRITDYIIGDVNNDDAVDMKDSMILGQYIAGFGVTLSPQGKKAAIAIYPDNNDDKENAEPTINDFQHLFRYLADWQVELGRK